MCLMAISFFSIAQTKDKIDQITIKVDPYKRATNGAFFTFMALSCSDRAVEYINDFDFEWGYNYELELKRIRLAQPLQDAGDTEYELIRVISKTAVKDSTRFEITLKGWNQLAPNLDDDEGTFRFNPDGTCTYLNEMVFHCEAQLKEQLEVINKSDAYKEGTFLFLNGKIHLLSIN